MTPAYRYKLLVDLAVRTDTDAALLGLKPADVADAADLQRDLESDSDMVTAAADGDSIGSDEGETAADGDSISSDEDEASDDDCDSDEGDVSSDDDGSDQADDVEEEPLGKRQRGSVKGSI
jgi:hypothetical protein